MCLDEDMSQVSAYDESSRSALQSLHGLESTENRWNDKALQVWSLIFSLNDPTLALLALCVFHIILY